MALFPCEAKPHRYAGPQQTIYPAISAGEDQRRRKLRLCPTHFDALLVHLQNDAQDAQLALGGIESDACLICHKPVTADRVQFFATVYATGQERSDFWAPLHAECVGAACEDWGLDP